MCLPIRRLLCLLVLALSGSLGAQEHHPAPDAEQVILKKLQTPLTLEFQQTPLRDAIALIAEKAGFPFVLDVAALADEGIDPAQPVTDRFRNSSAASVLRLLDRSTSLAWLVREGVLYVTTETSASDPERFGVVKVYDVSRLLKLVEAATPPETAKRWGQPPEWNFFGYHPPSPDSLVKLIESVTGGPPDGPWLDIDGDGGTAKLVGGALTVRQTLKVQLQIQALLTALETAYSQPPSPAPIYVGKWSGYPLEADRQLRAALQQPASYNFQGTPLAEAMRTVEQQLGHSVRLDSLALGEEMTSLDSPIHFQVEGITQQSALTFMLSQHGLSYLVEEGHLIVTTETAASDQHLHGLITVYNLRNYSRAKVEAIIEAILKSTGGPPHGPWIINEGEGELAYSPGGVLVVWQTQETQSEVQNLVARLARACQPAEQLRPPLTAPTPGKESTVLVVRHYRFYQPAYCQQMQKALPALVAPDSWGKHHGTTIQNFGTTLAIRQTPEVHRQIVEQLQVLNRQLVAPDHEK